MCTQILKCSWLSLRHGTKQKAKQGKLKKQEAQLMLTNLCNAFGGQSRSPNIVPFHMLGIFSYCATVTLSLRCTVFTVFDFKKCCDLEMGVKGLSMTLSDL